VGQHLASLKQKACHKS